MATPDFQQMQQNYPAAVTCAEKIRTFVLRKYGVFLPNEETAYLALHVARLTSGK
jgi:beta-glucoside operon transcriptional antiterminator